MNLDNYKPKVKGLEKCPFAEKCFEKGGHYSGGDWCLTPPYRKCDMWRIYMLQIKEAEMIIKNEKPV